MVLKKDLSDFVRSNSLRFFKLLNIPTDFLQKDIKEWEQDDSCKRGVVLSLRVVNDVAELGSCTNRSVGYSKLHTRAKEQK